MNPSDFQAVRLVVNYPILHIASWLKTHLVGSQATIIVPTTQQWASDFFLTHYQSPKRDLSEYIHSCQEHLVELCQLAASRGFQLKMLPFPISGTFIATHQEIVSIPVFDTNHTAKEMLVPKEDIAWHYYHEYLSNLERMSEAVSLDKVGELRIPELLGICTSDGKLATSMPRKWVERENKLDNTIRRNFGHRHIYCLVLSTKGRILLHQRVSGKDNELLWDKSNGGHVCFGEPTVETCLRELEEELSIRFDGQRHTLQVLETRRQPEDHLRFVPNRENSIFEYGMYDLFLLSGVDEGEVKLDETEVLEVKWYDLADAIAFIEQQPLSVTPDLGRLLPVIQQLHLLRAT